MILTLVYDLAGSDLTALQKYIVGFGLGIPL